MANNGGQSLSLDDMLRESREKRKAQQLAQEMFGRASKTPATTKAKPALGASLASRVGVQKRTASLPRTNSAPARNARPPPAAAHMSRPSARDDNYRPVKPTNSPPSTNLIVETRSNGHARYNILSANGNGAGVSIRGAATALPNVVVASNFAPGTTAADIESVMLDVGGQMTDCRLVTSNPTVMAEMTFVEKSGAETVIDTFNNKKADGRTLHVYWKHSGTGSKGVEAEVPVEIVEDTMELDENAKSREAENRLREERRGRVERAPRDGFPSGPKGDRGYEDDYYRDSRRAEPAYQDGRYGFGGGDRYGGGRGRYRDDGRRYGPGWRP